MSLNPIVSINELHHNYGGGWAVKNLSLKLYENQIVGLLGSNGAGKSTTMNALCGIITPTKGSIKIADFNLQSQSRKAKKLLGFLPQKAPLYPDLSVNEYLSYAAHLRQVPKKDVKASVSLVKKQCGLQAYGNRLIKNLSGGYQQRVGLAQAIIHKPKLVVLDEPTNGLDPIQIKEVRNLIRDISKNTTVLISTHILSEVKELCDHIIMIENGTKVFQGTAEEFKNIGLLNRWTVVGSKLPQPESLDSFDGISSVSSVDGVLTITTHDTFNPSNFIKKAVEETWGLREIYKNKISLEKVFANLSGKEKLNRDT